jgi:hypothetical protein
MQSKIGLSLLTKILFLLHVSGQVRSADTTTGVALVEVYEVP